MVRTTKREFTIEIWKTLDGYDMYDVSTHGRVRSWSNRHRGRCKKSRMLKAGPNSHGYPMVGLYKNGRVKMFCVHCLVLTAFVGPRPLDLECCHGDGNRTNNRLGNLRWDTKKSNYRDAMAHGTVKPPLFRQGEAHCLAKLTEEQVIEIRKRYAAGGIAYSELGAQFGVDQSTIGYIIRRKTWAHLP